MANIFDTIDKLAAELQSLMPMRPEHKERLEKKIRLEFNYNSNHIEGNTLTYGETELLLIFDKTTGNHELREYEEMKSHDVAFEMIKEWAKDTERPLNEADLKNLHKVLLVRPFWKEAITPDGQPTKRLINVGTYKKYPNSVRLQNGTIFNYASPDETPIKMGELIDWYREEEEKIHPVTLAAMLHYKFVCIHPFDDGNGRISRLLMNYVLLQNNLPPVIIKSADKKNYLFALNRADTGDYEAFISYIAEQLKWSLEMAIKAAKCEALDEQGDLDKKIALLERELKQIDPEQEIKTHFNRDVFLAIRDTWLVDLINQTLPVIEKFNKFFLGSSHFINIKESGIQVSFVDTTPKDLIERLKVECERNKDRLNVPEMTFKIQAFYGTLIKGGDKTFGCNYGISVKFDKINYEIAVDTFEKESEKQKPKVFYKRLLHIPLQSDEMANIADYFGNQIFEHIDFYTRKNGLR